MPNARKERHEFLDELDALLRAQGTPPEFGCESRGIRTEEIFQPLDIRAGWTSNLWTIPKTAKGGHGESLGRPARALALPHTCE
jgi:hypothetical protein